MAHDVFISYSSKNSDTAKAVCHVLEENKIKCWMAPRDIMPGADYADCIDQAITDCKLFILIFSGPSQESKWVKGELNVAFDTNKLILPFRVENVSLHGAMRVILNDKHWLEAYPNPEKKFEELAVFAKEIINGSIEKENTNSSAVRPILPAAHKDTSSGLIERLFFHKRLKVMSNGNCRIRINGKDGGSLLANTLRIFKIKHSDVYLEVVSNEFTKLKVDFSFVFEELNNSVFKIDIAAEEKKYAIEQADKGRTYELNHLGTIFLEEEKYDDAQQCFLKASNIGRGGSFI